MAGTGRSLTTQAGTEYRLVSLAESDLDTGQPGWNGVGTNHRGWGGVKRAVGSLKFKTAILFTAGVRYLARYSLPFKAAGALEANIQTNFILYTALWATHTFLLNKAVLQ
jgi:hypothetical protein